MCTAHWSESSGWGLSDKSLEGRTMGVYDWGHVIRCADGCTLDCRVQGAEITTFVINQKLPNALVGVLLSPEQFISKRLEELVFP